MRINSALPLFLLIVCTSCTRMSYSPMEGDAALQRGDYVTAIEIFMPAAQAGDTEAAYKLGQAYKLIAFSAPEPLTGTFQKAAERWLGVAVGKKHPLAAHELAQILIKHTSAGDKKRAVELYELAADQGVTGTAYSLGLIYLNGLKAGDATVVSPDSKAAARWFEIAIKENDFDAAFKLALLLRTGGSLAKDEKRAAELIKLAAGKGHVDAQAELAIMYLTGKGVDANATEAFQLFKKLAEEDDALMALYLAHCYEDGTGTEINDAEAVRWYETAAKNGSPEAAYFLLLKLVLGEGTPRNTPRAYVMWQQAFAGREKIINETVAKSITDMNDFILMPFKSRPLETPISEPEAKSFQAQAELGDALSQYKIALALERGEGIEQDITKAAYWHEKSANQGNVDAMTALGSLYRNGKGVTKDYARALQFFKRAADKGHAPAQTKLGVLYDFGYGVARDQKVAGEWYQKAADQGYAQAQYNLASMYLKGEGVEKNSALAIAWFEKAAAQDEINAITRLAQVYAEGADLPADMEKSVHWLEKAAEWGEAAVIEKLAGVYAAGSGIAKDRLQAAQWWLRLEHHQNSGGDDADSTIFLSKERLDKALKDADKLYTEIRMVPYFENGQPSGFKFLSIKKSSLFADLGLRRGDVLVSIDGIKLDIQNAMNIFAQISSQTRSHTLDIIRKGVKKTITIEIK